MGDFEQVRHVWVAGAAKLIAMTFGGDFVGAANDPGIFGRAILAELGKQLFQTGIQEALSALAVKLQGKIA